jgi:hypothetical protein
LVMLSAASSSLRVHAVTKQPSALSQATVS